MLQSIQNFLKEITDSIEQRLQNPFSEKNKTPFTGAFVAAFFLYNWELVFTIFNFDDGTTLQEKIQIIKPYLAHASWFAKVGWPLLIAFSSILFFYIFNNVSLGITTFFNQRIKPFVLYITDRGKIVAREDYDRLATRAIIMKQSLERTKQQLNNSDNDRTTIDKQFSELATKYDQVVQENQSLKVSIETRTSINNTVENAFVIVYARYGTEEQFTDVTEVVNTLITNEGKFNCDNRVLEGDPVEYSIKELFIVYLSSKATKTITVNEGEIVELVDGRLITHSTPISEKKHLHLKNLKRLGEIFNGAWVLTFSSNNIRPSSEPIIVDDSGKYFAHSQHRFFLRTVAINDTTKTITFNKIDLQRRFHSKETLTIRSEHLITGTDSKGFKLEYRKKPLVSLSIPLMEGYDIQLARHPFNLSISSHFLASQIGTFGIWCYVTDIHNEIQHPVRYMYIAGHATNNGNESNNNSLAKYPNAWAIQRIAPTEKNKLGIWRFWCNATEITSTILDYNSILQGGWHLFTICWSSFDDYIKFVIDKSVVAESKFENWPSDLSGLVILGSWPQKNKRQYIDSKIGPWKFIQNGYDANFIDDFFASKPNETP